MLDENRWVFLDFAETLAHLMPSDEAMLGSFLAKKGSQVDHQSIKALLDKIRIRKPYSSVVIKSPADRERYLIGLNEELLMHFGLEKFSRELFQFMSKRASGWILNQDSLFLLGELRKMNFKLGVASNFDGTLRQRLMSLGIHNFFSQILVSAELGLEKPDASFFSQMSLAAKTSPENIFHIGDSFHLDYEPARAAGLNAILVSPYLNAEVPQSAQVRTLREALDLIKSLSGF